MTDRRAEWDTANAPNRLRVVSHNAGWFVGVPMARDIPGPPCPEVIERLAVIYRALAPDALCLQQVQSREAFNAIQEALGMVGTYCPGGALPQYGGAVFWRDAIGAPLEDSHLLAPPVQYMWQIVQICNQDGCLQLANTHLPSSRQLGHHDAARQRIVELAHLLRSLPSPAMLVGDMNEPPNGVLGTHLGRQGFVDAGQLSGNVNESTSLGGGRPDQIWTDVAHGVHLRHYGRISADPMICHLPGLSYLADHLPIWAHIELEQAP